MIVLKIAVSGKGGVGKTVIVSNLAKILVQKGYQVYAVDASPDSNLGFALGVSKEQMQQIKPMVDLQEFVVDKADNGTLFLINPDIQSCADQYSMNINGIHFLKMYGVQDADSACNCQTSSFLRTLMNALLLNENDIVLFDMGAGIEQLARRTVSGVDWMLIVSEASKPSVETAKNIRKMAEQLATPNIKFIGNKIKNDREEFFIRANFGQNDLLGVLHYSEDVSNMGMGLKKIDEQVANSDMEMMLEMMLVKILLGL